MTAIEKQEKMKEIKEIASLIKTKFNTEKIILFGSYAYGEPTKDSDVDLLVVIKTDLKPVKQAVLIKKEINKNFGIKFPLDIIVRSPEFIEKRRNEDFFIKKILNNGIYL